MVANYLLNGMILQVEKVERRFIVVFLGLGGQNEFTLPETNSLRT